MKNGLSLTSTKHSTLVFKHTSFITPTSQLLEEDRGLWFGLLTVQFSLKPDERSGLSQIGGAGLPLACSPAVSLKSHKKGVGSD